MKMFSKKAVTKMVAMIIITIVIVAAVISISYYLTLPTSPEEIKIGAVYPLTGPSALVGQDCKRGFDMAAEEINAAGGVLGKNIRIIEGDDESKPEKAASETERLITKEKVVMLAGQYHSSCAMASIEISHNYMIPDVIASAASLSVREKQYSNVFCVNTNTTSYATFKSQFTIEALKSNAYAIMTEETDYGRDVADSLEGYMNENSDAKLVYRGSAKVGETDYYPMLTMVNDAEPDTLILLLSGMGVPLAYKQAREIGIPAAIHGAIYALQDFIDVVGSEMSEYYFATLNYGHVEYSPKSNAFWDAFVEKYERDPSYLCARAYDAVYIACDAIKRAESVEADKIIGALKETNFVGVRGTVFFDPVHQQWPNETYLMCQIQGGQAVIVYPFNLAEKEMLTQPWVSEAS